MPSSAAITAAVRGWSPVIISGRMPARLARATASFASGRGGSIMPISPANTRSCSTRSSGRATCSASASLVSQRAATPSVRSASAGERVVGLQDLGPAGRRQRPTAVADHLEAAARQEHVGRALREHDAAALLLRVAVDRAHQLALGRERHLADARQPLVERVGAQPGLARGHQQRAFGGVPVHDPAAVALLDDGVVRPIGDRQRTLELDALLAARAARRPRAGPRRPARSRSLRS